MRIRLLAILAGTLLGAIAGGAFAQAHPWAMRYATAARTGQSDSPGALVGELSWKYRVPGTVPQFAASASGDIILGSTFNQIWWSEEEYVSALRPDGNISWRKKVVPYVWGFAQGVRSGPALDSSGNIILPAPNAQVLKFDPSINLLWTYQENSNTINDSSPAVLGDGSVRHIQAQSLRAISPAGTQLWTSAGGGSHGSVAVAPNGEMAAINDYIREEHVFPQMWYWNADGTLRWMLTAYHGGNNATPIFGPDGVVYTSTGALNPADGSVRWSDATNGTLTPALGKNGQFYTVGLGRIRAHNKDTGALLWDTVVGTEINEGVAIDSRDVIYATTTGGDIVAVSPAGAILWRLHVCDTFKTGPIIGPTNLCIAYGRIGFGDWVFAVH